MREHHVRERLRKHVSDLADTVESAVSKVPCVGRISGAPQPRVNLYETPDALIVRAEVPGVSRENLEVRLVGGKLHIRCRPDAGQYETYTCLVRERNLDEYSREIDLPVAIDEEADITAVLTDGVLTVRLGRLPLHRGKSINVEAR